MVAKAESVGIDATAAQLRKLRNAAEFRGIASALFTGARNDANTGFGRFTGNNEIDIFKIAATVDQDGNSQGQSPLNTWLSSQVNALYTVHAHYAGLYIGQGLADGNTGQVKALIAEHGLLTIETESLGIVCKQNVLTTPPGTDIRTQQTDSAVYVESFGPLYPVGLFRLPKNTIFAANNDVLRAKLKLTKAAVTRLTSNAGPYANSFPSEGAIIAVIIYGIAEYKVGARAS